MADHKIPFLSDIFGNPKERPSSPNIGFKKDSLNLDKTSKYNVIEENWYTAKPYGFKFTPRNGTTSYTMFLPIAPSNLTISTGFATNAIATLYGTVEEHSPVRYYDITIEGTTGMAPRYVEVDQTLAYSSRAGAPIIQGISTKSGFFSKTLSLLDKIQNTASSLSNDTKTKTALKKNETGYLAFHNLYRFLLKYKEDVSSDSNSATMRHKHPLTFFNYKDNNQYDVVVRNFSLRRSADNPMLYFYSIQLRGYNLQSVSGYRQEDTIEDTLKQLGLDGIDGSSILDEVKGTSDKVKGILGPLGAGINILGR